MVRTPKVKLINNSTITSYLIGDNNVVMQLVPDPETMLINEADILSYALRSRWRVTNEENEGH